MKRDGGPAFPGKRIVYMSAGANNEAIPNYEEVPGMTLRDYFAGQALSGELHYNLHEGSEENAKWCYKMADAMLAERERE